MLKSLLRLSAACVMVVTIASGPAAADDLDEIMERGTLRVASSGAYPPFSFTNDQNEVVGFDVAIGSEIARRMGVEPEIVTTAWDGIIAGLLAGRYDTIVGSMSITPEREEVVDFVGPYYRAGRAVFVAEDSDAQSLDDLQGSTVGVTLGETHEEWAREQTDMNWNLSTYRGLQELLLELRNGRIDAMVVDSVAGLIAINEAGWAMRQLDTPDIDGGIVDVGIAIRQDNPELAAAMQAALDEMMEDGTYEEIAIEWVGSDIR